MPTSTVSRIFVLVLGVHGAALPPATHAQAVPRGNALDALERGLTFFASLRVAGGWPMAYSSDLKERWGEWPECDERQITVQPPATPWVLDAYWRAYEATGDERWRSVALTAANVLVDGQRKNGGWWYEIRFDPTLSEVLFDEHRSSFDDMVTQGTIQGMIRMVRRTGALRYKLSAQKGLDFLLDSRYPDRGWPQLYPPGVRHYYKYDTLNDGVGTNNITTLLIGWRFLADPKYLEGAKAAGDWLLRAQLPRPHRGWAQQYDANGEAAPARWFEPPACTSTCTANVIEILCDLFEVTGENKYLEPIPDALDWLESTRLTEGSHKGQWTRYREIGTNAPIFVDADKKVVYEDVNLRKGYAWFVSIHFDALKERYERLVRDGPPKDSRVGGLSPYVYTGNAENIERWIQSQDPRGAWVDERSRISTGDFCRAVFDLCAGL